MSTLVTGGAGYIGGTVARYLKSKGENIVILDDLSKSKSDAIDSSIIFYEGSIADKNLVTKIIDKHKIDECIHFAAFIEVGESVKDPSKYFQNNVSSALTLFDTLKNKLVNRVVFSSTAAVYGEPEYTPIDENHPKKPTNPYGLSKLFTEHI